MCNTSGNYVSAAVAKTANPASTKTLKCPLSLAFCQGTGLPNSVSIWSIQDMGYDISPSVVACSPVTAPLVLPGSPQAYKTHQVYKLSRARGSRPGEAEALAGVAGGGRVGKVIARFARLRRPMRSRRRRPHGGHVVSITGQGGWLPLAAAALHQLQRGLPELQQLLACPGVALGAPPAP